MSTVLQSTCIKILQNSTLFKKMFNSLLLHVTWCQFVMCLFLSLWHRRDSAALTSTLSLGEMVARMRNAADLDKIEVFVEIKKTNLSWAFQISQGYFMKRQPCCIQSRAWCNPEHDLKDVSIADNIGCNVGYINKHIAAVLRWYFY